MSVSAKAYVEAGEEGKKEVWSWLFPDRNITLKRSNRGQRGSSLESCLLGAPMGSTRNDLCILFATSAQGGERFKGCTF